MKWLPVPRVPRCSMAGPRARDVLAGHAGTLRIGFGVATKLMVLVLTGLTVVARLDYRKLRKLTYPLLGVTVLHTTQAQAVTTSSSGVEGAAEVRRVGVKADTEVAEWQLEVAAGGEARVALRFEVEWPAGSARNESRRDWMACLRQARSFSTPLR